MYGSSQSVVGEGLARLGNPPELFSADKVWTRSGSNGPAQIEESRRYWGIERFDLLQVHNLLGWEEHLETLFAMKAAGTLRYVGITTSEGRRHRDVEEIMRSRPLDFVQLTYNVVDREAENRILPLAQERGIGVIVNRPFQQGALVRRLEGEALPDWAAEIGAETGRFVQMAPPAAELIQRHSEEEHDAARCVLIEYRHVHQAHAVVQAAHQKRAEQRAKDAAASAGERRATNDRGGDRVEFQEEAGGAADRAAHARRQRDPRDAIEKARR